MGELYAKLCKVMLEIHQKKLTRDALGELKEEWLVLIMMELLNYIVQ